MNTVCNICHKEFSRPYVMLQHQKKIHALKAEISTDEKKFTCPLCGKTFSRKFTLQRHQQTICLPDKTTSSPSNVNATRVFPSTMEKDFQQLVSKIKELEIKLEQTNGHINEIRETPKNILQVICITNSDNYLDMLTDKMGNFEQAIDYIKDCALSDVSGDCKLIEKIYDDDQSLLLDRKSNIIYYNEKKEQIVEHKDQFGRKLANNLQNSYLRGVNYLINKNLDRNASPNKFLDDYDIISWNRHIYNLSDNTYQKKMMTQLSIPHGGT